MIEKIFKVCRSGWAEEDTEDSIWGDKKAAQKRCDKLNKKPDDGSKWNFQTFILNKETKEYELIL